MSISQSAASFVGTKPAPKSRKPRKPAAAAAAAATPAVAPHNQKVMAEPVTSIVAMFAEQQVAAPKAAPKARSKCPSVLALTSKGKSFTPRGKSEVSKTKDQITWPKLTALFGDGNMHTLAEVLATVPDHRDYVGYAIRRGWLAAAAEDDGV